MCCKNAHVFLVVLKIDSIFPKKVGQCSAHVHTNVVFLYFCQLTITAVILGSTRVGTASHFPCKQCEYHVKTCEVCDYRFQLFQRVN